MESRNAKIIFFGTPDFAAKILEKLADAEYDLRSVFTQPDKKIGRDRKISESPVKRAALKLGIEIFQPENLEDSSLQEKIKNLNPDVIIVAAYGRIFPEKLLEIPRFGCINVHASLLPKYRGASPIQNAILDGEKKTGITIIRMNEKMDQGPILYQEEMAVGDDDTLETLSKKLAELSGDIVSRVLPSIISGKLTPREQDEEKATYCRKINKKDGQIDWTHPAAEIHRKWRAFLPWPGTYSYLKKKGKLARLKLIKMKMDERGKCAGVNPGKIVNYGGRMAVCSGKGMIIIESIQPEGKKIMKTEEFLAGNPHVLDDTFLYIENG